MSSLEANELVATSGRIRISKKDFDKQKGQNRTINSGTDRQRQKRRPIQKRIYDIICVRYFGLQQHKALSWASSWLVITKVV